MSITDEEIKVAVVEQLHWDDRVDASGIAVMVQDSTVTLSGSAPSILARHAASEDAWSVRGVVWVENSIQIGYPEKSTLPADEKIKSNLEKALSWNPTIHASDITVSVNGGLVTFEGSVDAYWKKVYAEELASHIRGVVHIANKLTVVPAKRIVDATIAREIMAALDRNVAVDSDSISVEVENGVVTLSGTQRSRAGKIAAFFTAVHTNGITHVDDRVTVKRA